METLPKFINDMINKGEHLAAILVLENRPELYKYRNTIGGVDIWGNTFTESCINMAKYSLLRKMKFSPSEIAYLYFDKYNIIMKDVINWDMPMQGTNIFSIALLKGKDVSIEIRDLLSMGYIPTKQDIYRYRNMYGENNLYRELLLLHKDNLTMKDILVGTRYESYRKFMAMNNHCKSWNSWRDILNVNNTEINTPTYNYGFSHNEETFLYDHVNTISPFHYIELRTNTGKYIVPINDITNKNPYTNEYLDKATWLDIQRKKEFLRMNGFPLEPIDINHKYDMGCKSEIEILTKRLGIDISIIDTREYILDMLDMKNRPLHTAYQILNTYLDIGYKNEIQIKYDLERFILDEIDDMEI